MSAILGQQLLKEGLVTQEQLTKAQEEMRLGGGRLGFHLVRLGFIEEKALVELLTKIYRTKAIDLNQMEIEPEIIQLVPEEVAVKHQVVPVGRDGAMLTIAMADPSNILAMDDVKFMTGYNVAVVVAGETALKAAIEKYYTVSAAGIEEMMSDFESDEADMSLVESVDEVDLADLAKGAEDAPVVKLVNMILADAIKRAASDIHVEPYEKDFRVRFRIDGVLYEIMRPPVKLKNALISRLKIMSQLDIAERRLPQDGRIKVKMGKAKEVDMRVSVLPTLFGEKVVLRLLDKSNLQLDMTRLGFEQKALDDFKESIHQPFGIVLVTGPTGSGKTTTLYSALSELNKTSENVSTAEDPVEYNLAGINQVQMHEEIGLTFAASLRAFLRQDPDIIMVGEIRDFETAEIAIKAALTGHLVLSTIHTNDAPSTVNRLLNMGIEPFLVASAVNSILAQRLVRRICSECKEVQNVPHEAIMDLGVDAKTAKKAVIYQGKGCGVCSNTGYKGRIAIYEVMALTEEIKECVLNGASSLEIKREAIRLGMQSLRMSAINKLLEGMTTVQEVARVTAKDHR